MNGALTRTSNVIYHKRPPANCLAARWAWDWLVNERQTALSSLRLVEGYWMGVYVDGEGADVDAIVARDNARLQESRKQMRKFATKSEIDTNRSEVLEGRLRISQGTDADSHVQDYERMESARRRYAEDNAVLVHVGSGRKVERAKGSAIKI